MLRVPDINQSIVAAPAVAVDDGINGDLAPNNGLKCSLFAVRDGLGIDTIVTFEKTEDDSLTAGPSATLTSDAMRAEVRLINFDLAIIERRLALAFFRDALPDFAKDHDD